MGYSELYDKIGYTFKNEDLLISSLTHSSIINSKLTNYTRLEYLGDSLIQFMTAEYLFNKFPNGSSGYLTDLRKSYVSNENLINVCMSIGLDKLILKKSKTKLINNSKVFADVVEALFAAIYLDSNDLNLTKNCFLKLIANQKKSNNNIKSFSVLLNEYLQKNKLEISINWIRNEDWFICELTYKGNIVKEKGRTKKEAKENASKIVYDKYILNK